MGLINYRFQSECNACTLARLTMAVTHDSVTSTYHDAWNTSFIFAHFLHAIFLVVSVMISLLYEYSSSRNTQMVITLVA